jgi:hypothetical protein
MPFKEDAAYLPREKPKTEQIRLFFSKLRKLKNPSHLYHVRLPAKHYSLQKNAEKPCREAAFLHAEGVQSPLIVR